MVTLNNPQMLNEAVAKWRGQGEIIAFVPTMGNLHEGHLSLVEKARQVADRVIVSIYVNPLQFGVNEDFDAYPRTLDEDQHRLETQAVDALFLPTTTMIYPRPPEQTTTVDVPELSTILCGTFRPGHFLGVATVVCKLLHLVKPDILVLGAKDYQQVAVIQRMVEDLFFAVKIITGETVREVDGLAKSSRNQYLGIEERQIAPILYKTMRESVAQVNSSEATLSIIESEAKQALTDAGFNCEYYEFRDAITLSQVQPGDTELILVAAVWLGKTRLIDNVPVTLR